MIYETRTDRRVRVLLRDFGYAFKDDTLIERGIRGFTSDRVVGRYRSALEAAELICPIVREPEFTDRLTRIQNPED